MNDEATQERLMETLSRTMVRAYCGDEESKGSDLTDFRDDASYVSKLKQAEIDQFLELANSNHVVVRALDVLGKAATLQNKTGLAAWCEAVLGVERKRIAHAVGVLHKVCEALEAQGCPVTVIKSLDHWPDLGSDLDLYTTADGDRIERAMREQFQAVPVARSWGDRLANKWNFQVPGLPELIEIHVQFLGQTGEHDRMAKRVMARRVAKTVDGYEFRVPAPEERIVISTLQRVYRHFYFRLCDMIDFAVLLRSQTVDFAELRQAAELAGIWPGVATFLCLIQGYIESFGGSIMLPEEVQTHGDLANSGVRFKNGFLRVSKVSAAELYGSQLLQAGLHRDLRALMRLPLLPPLAVSALLAYRFTGNDKGIW